MTLIALIVLVGGIPSLAWALWPDQHHQLGRTSAPDPRYATQGGSSDGARKANIEQAADEKVDAAVETCGGVGLDAMAAKYELSPDVELVARRFASSFEAAYRERVYSGCVSGLLHGG